MLTQILFGLLFILKWAFIIVFSIICIILVLALLLILIVLFTPINDEVAIRYDDTNREEPYSIDVKVNYFFKLIKFNFFMNKKETTMLLKVFGKKINLDDEADTKKSKSKDDKSTYEQNPKSELEEQKASEQNKKQLSEANKQKPYINYEQGEPLDDKKAKKSKKDKKAKKSKKDKKDKKESFITKAKYYYSEAKNYKQLFWTEKTKTQLKAIFSGIKLALKPKEFRLDGEIGRELPSDTGELVGKIYMFKGMFNIQSLNVKANFSEQVLKADVYYRGKIKVNKIVVPSVKLAITLAKTELKRRDLTFIGLIRELLGKPSKKDKKNQKKKNNSNNNNENKKKEEQKSEIKKEQQTSNEEASNEELSKEEPKSESEN